VKRVERGKHSAAPRSKKPTHVTPPSEQPWEAKLASPVHQQLKENQIGSFEGRK